MNKQNLEILGLTEPVTEKEITEAYEKLRAKYMEERFEEGEVGNNAARQLTKIETAYNDLMSELSEQTLGTSEGAGMAYDNVEELIRKGDINGAQKALDEFTVRNAQWHYLQSVVFYRKNWINESRKQVEIAVQLDPTNAKYRETLRKFAERGDTNGAGQQQRQQGNQQAGQQQAPGGSQYNGQNMNQQHRDDQMGGNLCSSCLECAACTMCLNCLCMGCR
ncbi:MAG: hypothetical protein LUD47_03940 [Clostridia bacterium]|nr:hypothetical protein [Clostridia bacterium]